MTMKRTSETLWQEILHRELQMSIKDMRQPTDSISRKSQFAVAGALASGATYT